jgi:hypothetical protein
MSGTIPNMTSVNKMPSFGTKRRRFIASPGSVIAGVVPSARQQRTATNEADLMRSVQKVPAGTGAINAQRAIYETMYPGEHLTV